MSKSILEYPVVLLSDYGPEPTLLEILINYYTSHLPLEDAFDAIAEYVSQIRMAEKAMSPDGLDVNVTAAFVNAQELVNDHYIQEFMKRYASEPKGEAETQAPAPDRDAYETLQTGGSSKHG